MKVLLLGATGLIGSHAVQALRAAGCLVTGLSRTEADFSRLIREQDWLPLVEGYDAVVNCVGIIRETNDGDFNRLHRVAPVALFEACEKLGVRRVVHVSAMGSAPDADTGYWRSKGAAEADLRARSLQSTIIRPSLVYGDEGVSSSTFRALATLPVLLMPMAREARVQPIHVEDLAAIIVKLVTAAETPSRELAAVGPRATSMAGYLRDLRQAMQAPASLVLDLPLPLARLMARVAAWSPASALTPETLRMLVHSADGGNTANAALAAALLGRPLRDPAQFAQPAQRIAAVWRWAAVLITLSMSVLWLLTAAVSWFGWPHEESRAWLAACGVPAAAQEPLLLAACFTDAAIGMMLLLRPRRWLWAAQLALVGGYTVVMSLCLPGFWHHPFGPLSKNLPLLAMMFLMWRASR
nr:NAD(P)H-binding protein [uncultured Duganella sp.]